MLHTNVLNKRGKSDEEISCCDKLLFILYQFCDTVLFRFIYLLQCWTMLSAASLILISTANHWHSIRILPSRLHTPYFTNRVCIGASFIRTFAGNRFSCPPMKCCIFLRLFLPILTANATAGRLFQKMKSRRKKMTKIDLCSSKSSILRRRGNGIASVRSSLYIA